jgi:hypothetical protein
MRKHFPIYEEAVSHILLCNCSSLNFLIYDENLIFFFISAHSLAGEGLGESQFREGTYAIAVVFYICKYFVPVCYYSLLLNVPDFDAADFLPGIWERKLRGILLL